MHRKRVILGVAVAATAATVLAACSSGGSSSTSSNSTSSSAKVTLSWWNNANTQPLLGVFTNVIKQFEAAHPNVTIKNVPMQNELFKTKVTPALRGNSPPDIFQQWGSGQQATQVQSGSWPTSPATYLRGSARSAPRRPSGRPTGSGTASLTTCTWSASGTARTCSSRPG